jgi:hypothetical protein
MQFSYIAVCQGSSRFITSKEFAIKVVLIPQLLEEITTKLRETTPLKQAVPESFPLLRAMQMALAFEKR